MKTKEIATRSLIPAGKLGEIEKEIKSVSDLQFFGIHNLNAFITYWRSEEAALKAAIKTWQDIQDAAECGEFNPHWGKNDRCTDNRCKCCKYSLWQSYQKKSIFHRGEERMIFICDKLSQIYHKYYGVDKNAECIIASASTGEREKIAKGAERIKDLLIAEKKEVGDKIAILNDLSEREGKACLKASVIKPILPQLRSKGSFRVDDQVMIMVPQNGDAWSLFEGKISQRYNMYRDQGKRLVPVILQLPDGNSVLEFPENSPLILSTFDYSRLSSRKNRPYRYLWIRSLQHERIGAEWLKVMNETEKRAEG